MAELKKQRLADDEQRKKTERVHGVRPTSTGAFARQRKVGTEYWHDECMLEAWVGLAYAKR